MGNVFEESLFSKQPKQFEKIDSLAKAFAANYCGSSIIRDSIFGIVSNYARKRELSLEISGIRSRIRNRGYRCKSDLSV